MKQKYEKLNQISAQIYGFEHGTPEFSGFMPATDEADAEEFLNWSMRESGTLYVNIATEPHRTIVKNGVLGVIASEETKSLAMTLAAIRLWDGVK